MSNIAIILLRKGDDGVEMFMVGQKHYSYDCIDCRDHCDKHIEYTNPAGKINKGESTKDAAKREFLEETGQHLPEINIDNMKVYEECDTIIVIAMLKETSLVAKKINSDEIDSVKWMNLNDIPKLKLRSIFNKLYENYVDIWRTIASKTES